MKEHSKNKIIGADINSYMRAHFRAYWEYINSQAKSRLSRSARMLIEKN